MPIRVPLDCVWSVSEPIAFEHPSPGTKQEALSEYRQPAIYPLVRPPAAGFRAYSQQFHFYLDNNLRFDVRFLAT